MVYFVLYEIVAMLFALVLYRNSPGYTTLSYIVTGNLWPFVLLHVAIFGNGGKVK